MMRRLLALLMAWMLVGSFALAEDEEISIFDLVDLEEELLMDDVSWHFPIALADMNPELVRLANKQVLLPSDYVPDPLVTMKARKANKDGSNANGGVRMVSGTWQLQEECAEHLVALMEAAQADGCVLYLKSAYRSYSTQATMYNNRLKKNNNRDDGYVAKPGASDHQTGLGCDVVPPGWTDRGMTKQMASTKGCIWMAEHCHEYGFIIRYPEDKEDVTEIKYEPWHLRYVGNPAATYIMENGLCLEEFQEQLQAAIQEFLNEGGGRWQVADFILVSAEEE